MKALLPVEVSQNGMTLTGFIGKPELSRGTRSFMNYYINGRHIKSPVIQKGIEAAYQGFTMTNRFPFTALFLEIDSSCLDVNVHPSKMEVRFTNQEEVFELFRAGLHEILKQATLIPKVSLGKEETVKKSEKKAYNPPVRTPEIPKAPEPFETKRTVQPPAPEAAPVAPVIKYEQQNLFQEQLLREEDAVRFRLIGQVFGTFWLIEYKDELLIIDQHAAHEKVLYEELMKELSENHVYSQNLLAPVVLTLTHREKEVLASYQEAFTKLGFEIEEFGGDEYAVKAVPSHFLHLASRELFYSILDELLENPQGRKTEMINTQIVGQVLTQFRERKGLTQDILSGLAGLDRTHYSKLERGLRCPTLDTVFKIGQALDIAPHIILQAIENALAEAED